MISGNMIGSYSQIGKTFVFVDEDGNEVTGVVTDVEQIFNATPEDVKIGKTFVSDCGVAEGVDTRTYRTQHGSCLIFPGENFSVVLNKYDAYNYTKFQAAIAIFNTTEFDSVATDKISLHDAVFRVNSSEKISDVTKNAMSKSVDLNLINDTDNIYIIHFNTYKGE
jgi:hypothetical protein